jgi:hypothetical protein
MNMLSQEENKDSSVIAYIVTSIEESRNAPAMFSRDIV